MTIKKPYLMRFLNKYFPAIMLVMICSTIFVYKSKQKSIDDFIKNSQECIIVLDSFDDSFDEDQKKMLRNKLKKLTFQDVKIEEKNGVAIVKIKCPPDKFGFFRKWILENKEDK